MPDLIDENEIDDVLLVNDDDSINMAKKLAKELGLGVGISSGANLIGSILLNEKIDKPVVTIFADDNKKYLSTDLFKEFRTKDKNIMIYKKSTISELFNFITSMFMHFIHVNLFLYAMLKFQAF